MKLNCGPTPWEKWAASEKWHRWFAWRPVQVDSHDCRWLEYVERSRNTMRLAVWFPGWPDEKLHQTVRFWRYRALVGKVKEEST